MLFATEAQRQILFHQDSKKQLIYQNQQSLQWIRSDCEENKNWTNQENLVSGQNFRIESIELWRYVPILTAASWNDLDL